MLLHFNRLKTFRTLLPRPDFQTLTVTPSGCGARAYRIPSRFLHLALQLLDLDQMFRIEGQRRVIAIRFMRAESNRPRLVSARFHCRRQPSP